MRLSCLKNIAAMLCLAATLQGCAIWSSISDERLGGTQATDSAISNVISSRIKLEETSGCWDIHVYCYYNHVFLVGQGATEALQQKAYDIAKKDRRVASVTTHWFSKQTAVESNTLIAGRLRTELIKTPSLNSTRVDTEVNAGRVVLLGVVQDQAEKDAAIGAATNTKGVSEVTSYLMLPPKGHTDIQPFAERYPGKYPSNASNVPGETPSTSSAPSVEPPVVSDSDSVESRDL